MSLFKVRAVRQSSAPPREVYGVLADVPNWPTWVRPLSRADFERAGTPDAQGAGAIRRMGALGLNIAREEILEARPPQFQRYTILSGLPVSHYVGTVQIDPDGAGSRITWQAEFAPLVSGTGWFLRAVLQGNISMMASGLARAAARLAAEQRDG